MRRTPNIIDLALLKIHIKTKVIKQLEVETFRWCTTVLMPYGRMGNAITINDDNFSHAVYKFSISNHSICIAFLPHTYKVLFMSFLNGDTKNPVQCYELYYSKEFSEFKSYVENYLKDHKLALDSEYEKAKSNYDLKGARKC